MTPHPADPHTETEAEEQLPVKPPPHAFDGGPPGIPQVGRARAQAAAAADLDHKRWLGVAGNADNQLGRLLQAHACCTLALADRLLSPWGSTGDEGNQQLMALAGEFGESCWHAWEATAASARAWHLEAAAGDVAAAQEHGNAAVRAPSAEKAVARAATAASAAAAHAANGSCSPSATGAAPGPRWLVRDANTQSPGSLETTSPGDSPEKPAADLEEKDGSQGDASEADKAEAPSPSADATSADDGPRWLVPGSPTVESAEVGQSPSSGGRLVQTPEKPAVPADTKDADADAIEAAAAAAALEGAAAGMYGSPLWVVRALSGTAHAAPMEEQWPGQQDMMVAAAAAQAAAFGAATGSHFCPPPWGMPGAPGFPGCGPGPTINARRGRRQLARPMLSCHFYINPYMLKPGFDLSKKIIGRGGCRTRAIYEATGAKVRLCGRGSGHVDKSGQEAPVPLMLAVACEEHQFGNFRKAVVRAVSLLRSVEGRFWRFLDEQCGGSSAYNHGNLFWVGDVSSGGCDPTETMTMLDELALPMSK